MAKVDVVVIAGGTIKDPAFRTTAGVDCKSLIPIHGKLMVQWVVEALRSSRSTGRIAVVGPACLADTEVAGIADYIVEEDSHEVENILLCMKHIPDAERILMVTSDMPLLTPEAVDDFVENAPEGDFVYPTVSKEAINAQFPNRKWVFVKTVEGEFTGSSAIMFDPEMLRKHSKTVRKVFDARRSVTDLVMMWGIGFAMKFAMGALSIKDVERKISQSLNLRGRAYISQHPTLAFDVDKPSDIALAAERLSSL